jgi:2-polyprenyl-6-methoxyphenol hydroxylase-like FAD-dependent oxidoreductase
MDPRQSRTTRTELGASMDTEHHDRALVLGGSIAGLLAARVLSDCYDEVVVVDRDVLNPQDGLRRGVPQARHLHGLLARGQQLLEAFFPGLTRELADATAPVGDMLADTRLCFGGHQFAKGPSGLTMVCASRPTLESTIRRRVAAVPSVRVLDGRDAVGLLTDARGRRVIGARVFGRADGSAAEEVQANLVVDATGRGSRLPRWLEALGYAPPSTVQLRVGVGYASREYRLPADALGRDLVAISAPTPRHRRGGALSRIEEGRWIATLMGVLGDHPPTDDAGFQRFAADLALPDVPRALMDGEAQGAPVAHRHPCSVWHRYERLRRFPGGLAVLGDAICSLNPIYGQGMTVAALQALALREHCCRRAPDPAAYLRAAARASRVAWALAAGADVAFPDVQGQRTPATRVLGEYVALVQAGASHDPTLGRAFLRVTSLVDPPPALLRPPSWRVPRSRMFVLGGLATSIPPDQRSCPDSTSPGSSPPSPLTDIQAAPMSPADRAVTAAADSRGPTAVFTMQLPWRNYCA